MLPSQHIRKANETFSQPTDTTSAHPNHAPKLPQTSHRYLTPLQQVSVQQPTPTPFAHRPLSTPVWLVLLRSSRSIDIDDGSVAAALDTPDDECDPEKNFEDDTNSQAGNSSVPESALRVAVCIGDRAVTEVGSVALVVCILPGPCAKETAADDEEHDGKAEAQDRPSLSKPLLLGEILLVSHCDGDVEVLAI